MKRIESRYCEMDRKRGLFDRRKLCKPGQSPDLPSFSRCPKCGGRVVRSVHIVAT